MLVRVTAQKFFSSKAAYRMAKSEGPVTIKKYANRRLYNTGTSTYVTLEDLATMVKNGEDFAVSDAKTGEDITRSVLTQIIFEQENKEGAQNLLPIKFLRQLIGFYGGSMQKLVPSLSRNFDRVASRASSKNSAIRSRRLSAATAVRPTGRGPGPPQHGSVQAARSRCSRRSRGAARKRAVQPRGDAPASAGGDLDELKRQLAEMQKKSRAARATATSKPSVSNRHFPGDVRSLRPTAGPARAMARPISVALQIIAAPLGEHLGGLFVLHPFGDGLEPERAAEIDQRAHERAVVFRARQVLHERAVDLDDVDAEPAQVAERRVAGAEIVDRDAAAQILRTRHEASRLVDVLDRGGLGDLK